MPDPHRIKRELSELLSRPHYSNLFSRRNQFSNKAAVTPASLAAETADGIMRDSPFVDPVEVVELTGGGLELYRAYDGISHQTALTLGRCWMERPVIETIWAATERWQGHGREQVFMEFLQSANFIHPQWNKMAEIACMQVWAGSRVVVVRGRGNWRAMRSQPGKAPLSPNVRGPGDVVDLLRMVPIPSTYQCIVPLYNDMWVRSVPRGSSHWPLLT
jgi:hypothetical protein